MPHTFCPMPSTGIRLAAVAGATPMVRKAPGQAMEMGEAIAVWRGRNGEVLARHTPRHPIAGQTAGPR